MQAAAAERSKLLEKAAGSLARGELDAALKLYTKIFDDDPHDWNVGNTLGDLYGRMGRADDAVSHFTMLAEQLAADGFAVRARALYRKILRLHPDNEAARKRVDELDRQQVSASSPFLKRVLETARTNRESTAPSFERCGASINEALARGDHRAAATVVEQFLATDVMHIAALEKLIDICVDGEMTIELVNAQSRLAGACMHAKQYRRAFDISLDLSTRDPGDPAHRQRVDQIIALARDAGEVLIVPPPMVFDALEDREPATPAPEPAAAAAVVVAAPGRPAPPVAVAAPAAAPVPAPAPRPVAPPVRAAAPPSIHVFDEMSIDLSATQAPSSPVVAAPPAAAVLPPAAPPAPPRWPAAEPAAAAPQPSSASVSIGPPFGDLLKAWSEPGHALEDIQQALLDDAASASEERFAQATRLLAARQLRDAIAPLEDAMCLPHLRASAGSRLARVCRDTGDPVDALEVLEWVAEMPPADEDSGHELAYELALTLEALGQESQALGVYRELLAEVGPGYRDVETRARNLTAA